MPMPRKAILKKIVERVQPRRTVRAAKAAFMAGTGGALGKFAEEAYQAGFVDELEKLGFGASGYYKGPKGRMFHQMVQTQPGKGFKKMKYAGPDARGRYTYEKMVELKYGTPEYQRAVQSVQRREDKAKARRSKARRKLVGVGAAGIGLGGAALIAKKLLKK